MKKNKICFFILILFIFFFNSCEKKQKVIIFGKRGISDSQFITPTGVGVDIYGNIFVCDSGNRRIQVFDKNNNFLFSYTGVEIASTISDIFITEENIIYLTTWFRVLKYKFDLGKREIKLLKKWGKPGNRGNGFFNDWANGIVCGRDQNMYVIDTYGGRIQKFDSNGKFLLQYEDKSILQLPFDIAMDNYDNIYVLDSGSCRVIKFDKNFKYILSWGKKGTGNSEFILPSGITVNKNFIYVTDRNSVKKFDINGRYLGIYISYLKQLHTIPRFYGITSREKEGQGEIITVDINNCCIHIISENNFIKNNEEKNYKITEDIFTVEDKVSALKRSPVKTEEYEDKTSVYGSVKDSSNRAVKDAIVFIIKDKRIIKKIYTDTNGNFDSGEISPGKYRINVWKSGYLTEVRFINIIKNSRINVNFNIRKITLN